MLKERAARKNFLEPGVSMPELGAPNENVLNIVCARSSPQSYLFLPTRPVERENGGVG